MDIILKTSGLLIGFFVNVLFKWRIHGEVSWKSLPSTQKLSKNRLPNSRETRCGKAGLETGSVTSRENVYFFLSSVLLLCCFIVLFDFQNEHCKAHFIAFSVAA